MSIYYIDRRGAAVRDRWRRKESITGWIPARALYMSVESEMRTTTDSRRS